MFSTLAVGFARDGRTIDAAGQLRRYILELSERLGMTADRLGRTMSAAELTERQALDWVHAREQAAADRRAQKGR